MAIKYIIVDMSWLSADIVNLIKFFDNDDKQQLQESAQDTKNIQEIF